MSLSLYMDVHVAWELTARLQAAGVDVRTAQEDGADELPDEDLLDRAGKLGRVMVTQDQDFLAITTKRLRNGSEFGGVFFLRSKTRRLRHYAEWLETYAKIMEPEEMANQIIYIS